MAKVDEQKKTIILKIIYCGAAQAGKTSNIRSMRETIAQESGKTTQNDAGGDMLSIYIGRVADWLLTLRVSSASGSMTQEEMRASWRAQLQEADGIVFVCDSAAERLYENAKEWESMQTLLSELGQQSVPIVVQLNKRDLRNAVTEAAIRKALRIPSDIPCVESIAAHGEGVDRTVRRIAAIAIERILSAYEDISEEPEYPPSSSSPTAAQPQEIIQKQDNSQPAPLCSPAQQSTDSWLKICCYYAVAVIFTTLLFLCTILAF
ncbi:MAG: ADP-ribosylation factor-like protein [Rectinema sp.]|nr:ADP-ribosylation factor-like protein [Rectinema sp.]